MESQLLFLLARQLDAAAAFPQATVTAATTLTSVSSGARTSTTLLNNPFIGVYAAATTVTETATLYDPRPAGPLASAIAASALLGPYTLVQTEILSRTYEYRLTYGNAAGSVETRHESSTYTIPSTWMLWLPAPTGTTGGGRAAVQETPAGVGIMDVPCGGGAAEASGCRSGASGAASSPPPDDECVARSMQTACQGQCALREGVWWCYQMYYSDYDTPLQMGRACWGANGTYRQLLRPCLVGDQRVGCSACKGKDVSWNAAKWIWD